MKLRVHAPRDLTYVSYPPPPLCRTDHENRDSADDGPGACSRNGAQWTFPTSHPKSSDDHFRGNVFRRRPNFDRRWELALDAGDDNAHNDTRHGGGHCPVDADPYLPWIHDAFSSDDGRHVEFVISNKRRCNTDPGRFVPDLDNLEPQVALMQPVPVRRIGGGGGMGTSSEFDDALMSSLWSPAAFDGRGDAATTGGGSEAIVRDDDDVDYVPPRYALATSLDDADEDARYTRFICRFHALGTDDEDVAGGGSGGAPRLRKIILGETLSTYSYNPELANHRKRGSEPMLSDAHDEQVWNTVYVARCPVPTDAEPRGGDDAPPPPPPPPLHGIIASGKSVIEGVPSIYIELIPIRTPVRRSPFGLPEKTNTPPRLCLKSFHPLRSLVTRRILDKPKDAPDLVCGVIDVCLPSVGRNIKEPSSQYFISVLMYELPLSGGSMS
jgi:hypothetical protein